MTIVSRLIRAAIAGTFLVLVFGLSTLPGVASNDAYGDGNYGACTYESCSITLTSSGSVNLDVSVPMAGGKCTVSSDAVGVLTDSSTGYTLTLNDGDTNNNMAGSSASIAAVSGSQASPVALSADTWGYRVDGAGGFGAGPTSAASNVSPSSTTFAPLPLSSATGDTLVNSSSPADPTVTTTVWYGACADVSIPAGSYSDGAVYTAVIN